VHEWFFTVKKITDAETQLQVCQHPPSPDIHARWHKDRGDMSVAGGCIPPAVPFGDAAVMGGDQAVQCCDPAESIL
jgi:hypothetical protein